MGVMICRDGGALSNTPHTHTYITLPSNTLSRIGYPGLSQSSELGHLAHIPWHGTGATVLLLCAKCINVLFPENDSLPMRRYLAQMHMEDDPTPTGSL